MKPVKSKQPNKENQRIEVSVRVRPLHDPTDKARVIVLDKFHLKCLKNLEKNEFDIYEFENVFGPETSQLNVYLECCKPLLHKTLYGGNTSVFAYGPTGTGKTYTVFGTPEDPGLVLRCVKDLFSQLNRIECRESSWLHCVQYSYCELYNETIRDLLEPKNKDLHIRQDVHGQMYISGLTRIHIKTHFQFMRSFAPATNNRKVAFTLLNDHSSRSHVIMTILVERINRKTRHRTLGKMNIIDLAGSENNKRTGNGTERLKESGAINISLLALGQVVDAINNNKIKACIPYRMSKLTRLLQDSLGGTAMCCMIVTLAPEVEFYYDNCTSLNLAKKAKNVVNTVRFNSMEEADLHTENWQTFGSSDERKRKSSECLQKGDNIDVALKKSRKRSNQKLTCDAHETFKALLREKGEEIWRKARMKREDVGETSKAQPDENGHPVPEDVKFERVVFEDHPGELMDVETPPQRVACSGKLLAKPHGVSITKTTGKNSTSNGVADVTWETFYNGGENTETSPRAGGRKLTPAKRNTDRLSKCLSETTKNESPSPRGKALHPKNEKLTYLRKKEKSPLPSKVNTNNKEKTLAVGVRRSTARPGDKHKLMDWLIGMHKADIGEDAVSDDGKHYGVKPPRNKEKAGKSPETQKGENDKEVLKARPKCLAARRRKRIHIPSTNRDTSLICDTFDILLTNTSTTHPQNENLVKMCTFYHRWRALSTKSQKFSTGAVSDAESPVIYRSNYNAKGVSTLRWKHRRRRLGNYRRNKLSEQAEIADMKTLPSIGEEKFSSSMWTSVNSKLAENVEVFKTPPASPTRTSLSSNSDKMEMTPLNADSFRGTTGTYTKPKITRQVRSDVGKKPEKLWLGDKFQMNKLNFNMPKSAARGKKALSDMPEAAAEKPKSKLCGKFSFDFRKDYTSSYLERTHSAIPSNKFSPVIQAPRDLAPRCFPVPSFLKGVVPSKDQVSQFLNNKLVGNGMVNGSSVLPLTPNESDVDLPTGIVKGSYQLRAFLNAPPVSNPATVDMVRDSQLNIANKRSSVFSIPDNVYGSQSDGSVQCDRHKHKGEYWKDVLHLEPDRKVLSRCPHARDLLGEVDDPNQRLGEYLVYDNDGLGAKGLSPRPVAGVIRSLDDVSCPKHSSSLRSKSTAANSKCSRQDTTEFQSNSKGNNKEFSDRKLRSTYKVEDLNGNKGVKNEDNRQALTYYDPTCMSKALPPKVPRESRKSPMNTLVRLSAQRQEQKSSVGRQGRRDENRPKKSAQSSYASARTGCSSFGTANNCGTLINSKISNADDNDENASRKSPLKLQLIETCKSADGTLMKQRKFDFEKPDSVAHSSSTPTIDQFFRRTNGRKTRQGRDYIPTVGVARARGESDDTDPDDALNQSREQKDTTLQETGIFPTDYKEKGEKAKRRHKKGQKRLKAAASEGDSSSLLAPAVQSFVVVVVFFVVYYLYCFLSGGQSSSSSASYLEMF